MNNKSREESFTEGFLHGSNDFIDVDSDKSNDTAYQEGFFLGEEIMDLENGESGIGGEEFMGGTFLFLIIIFAGIFIANHLVFAACIGVLVVSAILLILIKNDSIKLAPGESYTPENRAEKSITRNAAKQKNNQNKRQSKKPPRKKIYEINISSDCHKSNFFCSKCVEVCPEGIFKNTKLPEWKYSIILTTTEERCTGCNACVEACPIGAITITKIRKTENDLEQERQERKNTVISWLNENNIG